mmetsp:Transcript_17323/g.48002  ORF Transcript_17323/g.48002 Transcript_17323/m.48002 type:complete len:98 (-) Transcript_17323:918-1211(-)
MRCIHVCIFFHIVVESMHPSMYVCNKMHHCETSNVSTMLSHWIASITFQAHDIPACNFDPKCEFYLESMGTQVGTGTMITRPCMHALISKAACATYV